MQFQIRKRAVPPDMSNRISTSLHRSAALCRIPGPYPWLLPVVSFGGGLDRSVLLQRLKATPDPSR